MFEKELLSLMVGGGVIVGSYWFVLRRGPYRVIFRMVTLVSLVALTAATLGVAGVHAISSAGAIGIALAVATPIFLAAFVNEIDAASEQNSKTNKWRLEEGRRRAALADSRKLLPWEVETVVGEARANGEFDGTVKVRIRQGGSFRLIGVVDPVKDVGEYHRLANQAQDAASTYESLGVVSESKALAKYDAKTQSWS